MSGRRARVRPRSGSERAHGEGLRSSCAGFRGADRNQTGWAESLDHGGDPFSHWWVNISPSPEVPPDARHFGFALISSAHDPAGSRTGNRPSGVPAVLRAVRELVPVNGILCECGLKPVTS
ncbi:hypothetical protein Amsp01_064790 [Amycolatopsis sp. NBRC 101858]|nr:hypothetical protein Amsp01_064790 [Amycolatopsis sp. NBRC 101858]